VSARHPAQLRPQEFDLRAPCLALSMNDIL
jgi:hypothetical protein